MSNMDMARYGGKQKWARIRAAILRRAGERRDAQGHITQEVHCERCGVVNHSQVWRQHKKGYTVIVLTTAHLGAPFCTGDGWRAGDPHDKGDIRAENLMSLCNACHLRHDLPEHIKKREENRARRLLEAGQLDLFPSHPYSVVPIGRALVLSNECKALVCVVGKEHPLTLPEACAGGFFLQPARLRRALANTARRGGLSRSEVFRRSGTRSHLPGGTVMGSYRQGSSQNIERGIPVPIQHESTLRAAMGAHGERFLDPESTARAILGGEPRRDDDNRHISSRAVVPDVRRGRGPNWHR
jgi:hypothetical protein